MEKIGICCGEDKKERTGTMTQLEKVKTREALSMYDNLWDQSAIIQQMRAASEKKGEEKGKAEGKIEGTIETFQKTILEIVQVRFPSLLDLAKQTVHAISGAEQLHQLQLQLLTAPDEEHAQALFSGEQDD